MAPFDEGGAASDGFLPAERDVGNRTTGRFFAVLRECIEIDLRRMVIAAAGGLQRRGSVGSIRTVLAVMTAYVRGTGLHRDALA